MTGSEKPDFKDALAVGRTLGVTLADSRPVQDAYAEAQAESPDWLFNHVVRSWLYGARLTERRALKPDAEVVGVSVLLHDLGLTRVGAPDRRFEVVGADAGRAFLSLVGTQVFCANSSRRVVSHSFDPADSSR